MDEKSFRELMHHEWLHQGPYDGTPFRDFVPPGALASISRMIDNPGESWPWPYEPSELDAALSCLPAASRDAAGRQIVSLARVYLGKVWREIRRPKRKPNPIEELRLLRRAANKLLSSIDNLSSDAIHQLRSKLRLHTPDAPDTYALRFAVDAFLHEHRFLRKLPGPESVERRGRKVELLERSFQNSLDRIFLEAFEGVRPKRGFPSFRKAVAEPFRTWRPSSVEDLSRRDLRRPIDRSTRQRRRKTTKIDI